MKEEELQEKYMQIQMLDQQIKKLRQHLEMLEEQLSELDKTLSALDGLSSTSEGTEVLAQIANGIFIKTRLSSNSRLVLNVGAGAAVEKTPDAAKKIINVQKDEMIKYKAQLEQGMTNMLEQMSAFENEFQGFMKKEQEKAGKVKHTHN